MIGIDLFNISTSTLRKYSELRYSALVERARSTKQEDVEDARDSHSTVISAYEKRVQGQRRILRLNLYNLKEDSDQALPRPGEWLNEREFAHRTPVRRRPDGSVSKV
ncbi:hypothetical protein [Bradyrhizobium zhanjiangense]|uniref:hypothetical protein n=1 Tax=Bradyrhizobium zhanjiangense TaxID=1325107 RepID=UPI00100911C9|nr:hypothetical protein [Bradyrhizobium zhanjiangense]